MCERPGQTTWCCKQQMVQLGSSTAVLHSGTVHVHLMVLTKPHACMSAGQGHHTSLFWHRRSRRPTDPIAMTNPTKHADTKVERVLDDPTAVISIRSDRTVEIPTSLVTESNIPHPSLSSRPQGPLWRSDPAESNSVLFIITSMT
jgi:hypothetical protein